jgi:hypothetical protein
MKETRGQECVGSEVTPHASDPTQDRLCNLDSSLSMVMHASGPSTAPVDWRDPTLTLNTSRYGSDVSQLKTSYFPAQNFQFCAGN